MAVVIREHHATLSLFLEESILKVEARYIAVTDGNRWSWYRSAVDASDLIPLDEPPPPPPLPKGQRWLQPIQDKRSFRSILRAMNVALRDSEGGGIIERFDVISRVLFTKVLDEREVQEDKKDRYEFRVEEDDSARSLWSRINSVWRRGYGKRGGLHRARISELTEDRPALYKMVEVLKDFSLLQTPGDVKGLTYEEILRNTFEKNENQQFFTPSEVVEFVVEIAAPGGDDEAICDPACGTGGFLVEAFKSTGYDAELVGADVDERLAQVAQMNLIMHTADGATVHHLPGAGSLAPLPEIMPHLPQAHFDLVLTNPPFGSDLLYKAVLEEFETGQGRTSRRRSVLFTERCLDLLRPGGRLAIVLDDSVLNLPSNSDIRSMITRRSVVEAVISLPDVTFMPYSTAKSSVLILRKREDLEPQGPVFMAEASEVGRRPNGDPLYSEERDEQGNRVLLSDLPGIARAYATYKRNRAIKHHQCFVTPASLLNDRLDIYHYHPKRFAAEKEISSSRWPTPALRELVSVRRETVKPAAAYGDSPVRWLGLGDIEEGTGEYEVKVVSGSRIKSAANVFYGGDLLFSKLRPNLRKVALVNDGEEGGLCSGEITVLRGLDKVSQHTPAVQGGLGLEVNSTYLAFMLRSDLVYGQLVYKVTGVGRPRVSLETILSVKIPLPSLEEQKRLVAVFEEARAASNAAKHEASVWMERSKGIIDEAYREVIAELTANGVDAS